MSINNMNNGFDIQDELKEMGSTLAGISRAMPYAVPEGYFEQLGTAVNEHCAQKWGKTIPYSVPQGYFEGLEQRIAALATSSINDTLQAEEPYKVPAAYFDLLPQQMLLAAKKETAAGLVKQRTISLVLKWAAAAVVIVALGLGSYLIMNSTPQDTQAEHILASVAPVDIEVYLSGNYRMDIDVVERNDDINKMTLDSKDIIKYLDETGWDL